MNKNKIVSLISGAAFLGLGMYFIVNQSAAIATIVFTAGILLIAAGVFEIVYFFTNVKSDDKYLYLIGGILDIILGVLFIFNVGTTADLFPIFVGAWIIARGIVICGVTIAFNEFPVNKGLLYLLAALNVIFGIFIICNPVLFDMTIVFIFGAYLIFTGVTLLINAFLK